MGGPWAEADSGAPLPWKSLSDSPPAGPIWGPILNVSLPEGPLERKWPISPGMGPMIALERSWTLLTPLSMRDHVQARHIKPPNLMSSCTFSSKSVKFVGRT